MKSRFPIVVLSVAAAALSACAPTPRTAHDPALDGRYERTARTRTIGSGPTGVMDSTTMPSSGNLGSGEINMPGAGNPANCSSAPTGQKPADC